MRAGPDQENEDLYAETWGNGFFIGRYPLRDRVGVFVGGPRPTTAAGPAGFGRLARSRLRNPDPTTTQALAAIEAAENPYYWKLADTRSRHWALNPVVLVGDAAAGFLPTAGIGAAMALESAAVPAAHLSGIPAEGIPKALTEYERERRPYVIAADNNSRKLAKLMFRDEQIFCIVRDFAMRFATPKMVLGPISKLHQGSPLPVTRSQ